MEQTKKQTGAGMETFFWLQAIVGALVIIVLVFTFFGRIIAVEGSSMVPTLQDGDRLLLYSVGYTPEAGDVVVLTKDSFLETPIVKRVIAVGGQTVEIDYEDRCVRVDGAELDEPYINELMEQPYWDQSDVIEVPEGSVFVMGDNRNHSSDSRDEHLGCVDNQLILGRAVLILSPFSHFGRIP